MTIQIQLQVDMYDKFVDFYYYNYFKSYTKNNFQLVLQW